MAARTHTWKGRLWAALAVTAGTTSLAASVRYAPARPPTHPVGWSNPQGQTLTQVRDNVWLAERPFFPTLPGLQNTDVGGKMAVVRLDDGALWVHSPVELDDNLREELARLGEVKHVVTPNTEHQRWAQQWIEAFPDATSYACPGLRERKPKVGWTRSVGATGDGEHPLKTCWVSAERVPLVLNRPFFSEVVFFHPKSKVLFVTDLWWNYPSGPDVPIATRLWKFAMDKVYKPVYNNLMQVKPDFERDVWARIAAWDFEYIAPCHGEPVSGPGVKAILAEHLGYHHP